MKLTVHGARVTLGAGAAPALSPVLAALCAETEDAILRPDLHRARVLVRETERLLFRAQVAVARLQIRMLRTRGEGRRIGLFERAVAAGVPVNRALAVFLPKV